MCLSLLGTWQGPGWVPGTSTLSQVLLSIQSQIMCDTPYANEPSFEAYVAVPAGKRAVAKHNAQIRLANIRHAMLEPLRSPKPGFKRAVGAFAPRSHPGRACCPPSPSIKASQCDL